MSSGSWLAALQTALGRRPKPRIAVVGVGNDLRGDDAAGLLVARALPGSEVRLVIEAGTAPENHTAALRRFRPDVVLMVDAAQMDAAPGDVRLFDLSAVDSFGASTHTLPLALVAQYLSAELGCVVLGLGIQPRALDFGAPLAPEVQAATAAVAQALQALPESA